MFIAISYISQANKNHEELYVTLDTLRKSEAEQKRIVEQLKKSEEALKRSQEQQKLIFENFTNSKLSIYQALKNEFSDDIEKWHIELGEDLSIKFTNPEVLFDLGKTTIKPHFKTILDDFLPRYFNIILYPQYRGTISEIRIEGHTDTVPALRYDNDPYIGNVILSQLRSTAVLKYFHESEYYQSLSPEQQQQLAFLLTANGLSYGRTLDSNKKLTYLTGKPISPELSRRVEFRIITNSANVIEKVLRKMESENEKY
ncbi:flagellar motor protein MotB [Basilea psittacipulmonis]|nr:OmpA family protein [Basilea psittacipulmonis]